MTLISKEKMLEKLAMLPADQFYNLASIRNFIKAEAEAVIRCGDCEHRNGDYCHRYHDGYAAFIHHDDYCNYAEREES